jgi:hypothetical protein
MLQADDGRFAEFEHAMIPGAFASKMLSPRFTFADGQGYAGQRR